MMARSGACLMLDPLGVAEQPPDHRSIKKTAKTSTGRDVSFWLVKYEASTGIWLLGASCPETQDPYGGGAIPSFLEVVCVDKGLALLRLRTPDRGVPTEYFVYNIADNILLDHRLPQIHPEVCSSSSVGLLCKVLDDGSYRYVVANLRLDLDAKTEQMEAHLDWWGPDCTEWIQHKVDPDFTKQTNSDYTEEMKHEYMCEWKTDEAVSLENCMLWVDLWKGILRSSDLLSCDKNKTPELEYVPLPGDLRPKWPVKDAQHRRERPGTFRSVACCQGKLKLVNLRSADGNSLEVEIWILSTMNWSWSKKDTYKYPQLWDSVQESVQHKFPSESLPRWNFKPACFPVLSTRNGNILYLTLSAENKAFLVRINLKDRKVRMAEYSPFGKHRNLLRSVDISKGNTNCTDPTAEWDKVGIWTIHGGDNILTRLAKKLLPIR